MSPVQLALERRKGDLHSFVKDSSPVTNLAGRGRETRELWVERRSKKLLKNEQQISSGYHEKPEWLIRGQSRP